MSRSTLTRTAIALLVTASVGLFASCGSDDSSSGSALGSIPTDVSSSEPADTGPVTSKPVTTDSGPPIVPATEPAATESASEVDEYGPPTIRLEFDDRTLPVAEPLADGIYYSQDTISDGTTITFILGQWFKCDTGVPDEPSVLCASGSGTLDEPSTEVPLAPDATVTINTGDLSDLTQADVSAEEFARLAAGDAPSAGAPDFTFYDFPTFVRVEDGVVVEANQIYTS
jgi:hypothetical protein